MKTKVPENLGMTSIQEMIRIWACSIRPRIIGVELIFGARSSPSYRETTR